MDVPCVTGHSTSVARMSDEDGGSDGDEQLGYDLGDWSRDARMLLDRLLEAGSIARVWEASTLVVRADDEGAVGELIDQVEASEEPPLDPDLPQVAYEMEGLGEDERARVGAALTERGIAHGWDETDDLVVYERDEERVEQLLDEIEYPDALDAADDPSDGGDGLMAQDTLSTLFVAADRLRRNVRDHQGVLALVDAADTVAGLSLPYGFEAGTWRRLVERSGALRAAIEAGELDDDELGEQAEDLRRTLRPYV